MSAARAPSFARAADRANRRSVAEDPYVRRLWPWLGAGLLLVGLAIAWYLLPASDWLEGLRSWVVGLGFAGALIFAAIYVVATVFLVPGWVLTVGAGLAYGFWGLPIVLAAATIGATLAFLVARYVARDRVRSLLESRRNIAAIDKAVAEDGWKVVVLLRLSPLIPFNLQNYLFGVTEIALPHYVAATFFDIIPGSALYVYLGVLGSAAGEAGLARWFLFGVGLIATLAVVVLVARKARTKLREAGVDERNGR